MLLLFHQCFYLHKRTNVLSSKCEYIFLLKKGGKASVSVQQLPFSVCQEGESQLFICDAFVDLGRQGNNMAAGL